MLLSDVVGTWPLVVIEIESEDIRVQKLSDLDSFLHNLGEVLQKQVVRDIVILELDDVPNNALDGAYLIVPECVV